MGGLYGHLSHLHEDSKLTFGEVKLIFHSISKNLIPFTEKVDGQAISVTWKGETLFARNKGHVQNRAENALTLKQITEKFEGRGDLTDAFCLAAEDINTAINSLSDEIKHSVFEKGENNCKYEIQKFLNKIKINKFKFCKKCIRNFLLNKFIKFHNNLSH